MSRAPLFAIVGLGVVLGLLMASSLSDNAQALSAPLFRAGDYAVTCGTTATQINTVGGNSLWCDNNSTTSVFLGGSDVDTTGICISKDAANCPRRDVPADFGSGALFCRVASGTVTLQCLAGK